MKIIKLMAENVKKLKAVSIDPKGNLIKITGKNEQGKSTVIDCIWWAIEGAKNIQKKPIRTGEDEAAIRLILGDDEPEMIVTRTFKGENTYLTVESPDGAVYRSPQAVLDKLIGSISVDPTEFLNEKPAKQKEVFLNLIGVDFTDLDNRRKMYYDERTQVNREVNTLKGKLDGLKKPDTTLPAEEISTANVLYEMRKAQEVKTANDNRRQELINLKNELTDNELKINDNQQEIDELEAKLKDLKDKKKKLVENNKNLVKCINEKQKEVDKLQDPNLDKFEEKLAEVEKVNEKIRETKKYYELKSELEEKQEISNQLTEKIKAVDEEKERILQEAEFPIEGLGFDEDGLTYKGLPFNQASQEEQLRVAMAIIMATNPDLRVIRTKNASLLDEDKLKVIEEMAKDKDFQVWAEIVDSSGKIGVFIEDGQVKAVND